MTQTSLTDVKAHLSAYVDSVVATHERISLTRNGRRDAVLIAADDLDALEETLDILSNAELMAQLRKAEAEVARGEATTERPVIGGASAKRTSKRASTPEGAASGRSHSKTGAGASSGGTTVEGGVPRPEGKAAASADREGVA